MAYLPHVHRRCEFYDSGHVYILSCLIRKNTSRYENGSILFEIKFIFVFIIYIQIFTSRFCFSCECHLMRFYFTRATKLIVSHKLTRKRRGLIKLCAGVVLIEFCSYHLLTIRSIQQITCVLFEIYNSNKCHVYTFKP